MIPLLLWLVPVCSPPSGPLVQGVEGTHAIAIGSRTSGELPLSHDQGRNAAQVTFDLEVAQAGTFTATLESFDFDGWLSVEDSLTGSVSTDGKSGAVTNAWLVYEAKAPAKLTVKIGAEDDRGGEFTLSILPGRVDPPSAGSVERTRANAAYCEAAAVRAAERGETARELSFWSQASQHAARVGDLDKAKDIGERYLKRAQESGSRGDEARARAGLGRALRLLGEWEASERMLQDALPAAEAMLAEERDPSEQRRFASLVCYVCDNLGDLKAAFRSDKDALPFYRRFAELAPRIAQPVNEALSLQKLGEALDRLGESAEAKQAIEKALAIAEKFQNPEVIANALLSHGRYFSRHGVPADCRRECERGLKLSSSPATRIELLGTLASAYIDQARYEQARAALDELEALCAQHGITSYEIPTRIDRGTIAFLLRDLPRARNLLEEALALQESAGQTAHRIEILVDLGLTLAESGEAGKAEEIYRRALEACELAGDRAQEARLLLDLADLEIKRKDYHAALEAMDRSADAAEKAGERSITAAARGGRGYVLFLTGEREESRKIAAAAAEELETLGEWDKAIDAHDTLARIGLSIGDPAAGEEALRAADSLFARHGDQKLDPFASAGMRSRFADWGCIAQDLVRLRSRHDGITEAEKAALAAEGWRRAGRWKGRTLLERMEGEREAACALTEPSGGELGAPRMPQIGPHTAVLEYADGLEKLYGYVAIQGSVCTVDLGERGPIEDRARRFVDDVSEKETGVKAVADDGAWLYERLVSPLLVMLPPGIDDLVIVPTPALCALPFEALVEPASVATDAVLEFEDLRYLVDSFCVTYAPSSPVVAALEERRPSGRQARFLILADPLYLAETVEAKAGDPLLAKRPGEPGLDYDRLRGTRDEANEIARLLLVKDKSATPAQRAEFLEVEGLRSASMSTDCFDLHFGADVRGDLLCRDLSAYTDVHIAAHGHLDRVDPRRSGLVLSYDAGTEGLFPLEDMIDLRLDADLVVLTACDMARGPIVRGEGVQSIAYAFLLAGSRSVVASLWTIEDIDAPKIMKSFYGLHLDRRLHPAKALRQAKLEFLRLRGARGVNKSQPSASRVHVSANPYFWSSLVYVGAPPGE